jgi:hypothetical protein
MDIAAAERGIHRRIDFTVTDGLKSRFARMVPSADPSECWNWQGALRNGYGAIKHDGKVLSAHAVSYRIHHGDIPFQQVVRHKCDNRQCVNPFHLQAGSFADNVRDMHERIKVNVARGAEIHCAKLNDAKVLMMRAIRLINGTSYNKIGKAFGVTTKTAQRVVGGGGWKHLAMPTRDEAIQIIANWSDE